MMNQTTLSKLKQMKFYGMHDAFKATIETGKTDDYTLDQLVNHLVETEWDDRQTRKINRCITNARFRYKASLEELIYDQKRQLDKNKVLRLASCDYIKNGENNF